MFQRGFLYCLFCILSSGLFAQEFTPVVTQFTKGDYNAGNQNWSVGQTSDGTMYFGNNLGLLQFDGSEWKLYKLPQNKIARSVYVSPDDKIYVGSFEEFGYFKKDEFGQLKYTSLSAGMKGYKMQNDEVWVIFNYNGTLVFQSFSSYFTFDGKTVRGFRPSYLFLFFSLYKNQVYTNVEGKGFGIFSLQTNKFSLIENNSLKNSVLTVLPFDATRALLATNTNGLFLFDGFSIVPFHTSIDEEIKKGYVNRVIISRNGLVVLGTILDGVFAINKDGEKVWSLNTSNVLQNNTILGMYCDKDDNLWLALDKGIAFLHLNSSVKYIHSFRPSIGSIYSVAYSAPHLYLGTNQGLYHATLDIDRATVNNIQLLPQIKGQVWDITKAGSQIFCGNNEDTYDLSQHPIEKVLSSVRGGICMKEGVINGQEVLVQGTYSQLCIYKKVNGKWVFSNGLDKFVNPIRFVEIDYKGTIWVGHLHKGLYSLRLSADLKKIDNLTSFKSLDNKHELPIGVFSINNRVVFTDNNGFYTFDDLKNRIIPFFDLNKKLGYFSHSNRISYFKDNLYWFIRNDATALVRIQDNDVKIVQVIQSAPFYNQMIDDYQKVTPIDENICLMNLENGLALLKTNINDKNQNKPELQFKSIITTDDESKNTMLLPVKPDEIPHTPFVRNNLIFTVFFPYYSNFNNIYYSYKLEGLDKIWSEPTRTSHKEYNYLPHNEYALFVRAMTKNGTVLSESSYRFVVNPPFYLTLFAKILYFLLLGLALYLFYRYITHLFIVKKEKIHHEQEQIRQKEIEKRERQITMLEKDKLESELTVKSKELAMSTMTLIKKNEMLAEIKDEVIHQKKMLGTQYPNKYYDKLIHILDENISSEDDWAVFQSNFDRIHENFFRNLKTNYPELTSNDLRFCAYLRLNLTTKDIAHLMNITPKGVEVGRYRIRKKIGIPSNKSLTEFMIEFK